MNYCKIQFLKCLELLNLIIHFYLIILIYFHFLNKNKQLCHYSWSTKNILPTCLHGGNIILDSKFKFQSMNLKS